MLYANKPALAPLIFRRVMGILTALLLLAAVSLLCTVPVAAADSEGTVSNFHTFPVVVKADNDIVIYHVEGGLVFDVLKLAGIEVDSDDVVTPDLLHSVESGDTIIVERHEVVTQTVEEEIPFTVKEIPTSLLTPGKTNTVSEGSPGLVQKTCTRLYVDGELTEETIEDEEVLEKPVTEYTYVGVAGAPISDLELDCELDENGIPVSYERVLTGQRAAGYSAPDGAGTASGRAADVGHVAVNPNVIPYGTELYIRSADGNFVYGYAIASDTGYALMDGRIDVDLFYDTYEESVLNGMRTVDIYILN